MQKDNYFTTNSSHRYLFDDQEESSEYVSAARAALDTLAPFFTKTSHGRELKNALQLSAKDFDEEKYLQAACETSVTASLAAAYPNGYFYEYKVNGQNKKDCDCSFLIKKYRVNVEIKCFNFRKNKEIAESPEFKISTWGDSPDAHEKVKELRVLLGPDFFIEMNHGAQNVKDYLIGAHEKFGDAIRIDELNVLVICANDASNMQDVFSYLLGAEGLLTGNGKLTYDQYKNVDVVVVSNLYHRHDNYWSKIHLSKNWALSEAFNLCLPTYWCSHEKQNIYKLFLEYFPNNTEEFNDYCLSGAEDSPVQKLAQGVPPVLKYVNKVLSPAERYYFEP